MKIRKGRQQTCTSRVWHPVEGHAVETTRVCGRKAVAEVKLDNRGLECLCLHHALMAINLLSEAVIESTEEG